MREKHILILGIGSPFGDDYVAWHVIEALKKSTAIPETVQPFVSLVYYDRPGINLLELMQKSTDVILVDAVKTGAVVGTCHQFNQNQIEQYYASISTHDIGIGYALKLGCALQLLPENIRLYGIEIDNTMSPNNVLSSPVQQAVAVLAELIISYVSTIMK